MSVGPHVPPPQSRSRADVPRTIYARVTHSQGRAWALGALTGLGALAYAAHIGLGMGGANLDDFFQDWVYCGVSVAAGAMCLLRGIAVREERLAWLVMGFGLLTWAAADITWTLFLADDPDPPYPSVSDVLYLAFYPASYVSLLLVARSRVTSFRSSLWLDGAIAGLTVAAVIATLVFQPILDATSGTGTELAVNLAYPVGDLLLLGLVVAVFGLNGWRLDPVWLLLGGGLALSAVADGIYLFQTAKNTYVEGTLLDTLWPVSVFLVAMAAWQRPRKNLRVHDWVIMAVPVGCGVVAVQLLVYDHFEPSNIAAVSLSAWALLLALARMTLAFLENQRVLARTHTEARTDSLTGLGNRRSLLADLEVQIELSSLAAPARYSCSTSTASRSTTTRSAIPPATACSRGLLHAWPTWSARRARLRLGGDEFCALVVPGREGIKPCSRPARTRSQSAARASRWAPHSGRVASPRRPPRPPRPCSSQTGACTPARAGAGCPRAPVPRRPPADSLGAAPRPSPAAP